MKKLIALLSFLFMIILAFIHPGCGSTGDKKSDSNPSLEISLTDENQAEVVDGFFDLYDYERGDDFGLVPLDAYSVAVEEQTASFAEIETVLAPSKTFSDRYNIPEGLQEFLSNNDTKLVDISPSAYIFDVFTNEQVSMSPGSCLSVAYDNDTGAFFARKEFPVEPTLGFFYYEFDILVSGELCFREDGRVGVFRNNGSLALPELGIENFVEVASEKGVDLSGLEGSETEVVEEPELALAGTAAKKKKKGSKSSVSNSKKSRRLSSSKGSKKTTFRELPKSRKPSVKAYYPQKKEKPKITKNSKSTYIPPDPGESKTPSVKPNLPSAADPKKSVKPRPNGVLAQNNPAKSYKAPSGKVRAPPSAVRKVKMAGTELPATRPQQNFHPGSGYKSGDPASEAASQFLGIRAYQDSKEAGKAKPGVGLTDLDVTAAPAGTKAKLKGKFRLNKAGTITPGKILGEGSFGRVQALSVTGKDGKEHKYAMKVFKKKGAFEEAQKAKKQIADLGENKHLLKDYGAGVDKNGHQVLIYERGGNDFRKEFIGSGGKRNKAHVDKAMKGMVAGMAHVHNKGKVHWDFKPQNVVMGQDGEAKIIDLDDLTPASKDPKLSAGKVHTPGYAGPERYVTQKGAKPFDSRKSDVYSVGIGLMELKTGKPVAELYEDVTGRRYLPGSKNYYNALQNGEFQSELRRSRVYNKTNSIRSRTILQMLSPDPNKRPDLNEALSLF